MEKIKEAQEEKKLEEIRKAKEDAKKKPKLSLEQQGSLVQKIKDDKEEIFGEDFGKKEEKSEEQKEKEP